MISMQPLTTVGRGRRPVDITGQTFGRITAIALVGSEPTKTGATAIWFCHCDCGNFGLFRGSALRHGNTKSCGCLKAEEFRARTTTHGKSKTKAYELWSAMIQRAKGNRAKSYVDLGIEVCDRWKYFDNFHADMGDPPAGYSLERVNNSAGYEPSNCKWIPMQDQWRNRRNTKLIAFRGELMSQREIEDAMGWTHGTIYRKTVMQGKALRDVIGE